jgi:hypothetical protein
VGVVGWPGGYTSPITKTWAWLPGVQDNGVR